ncbi:hypothetical protein HPB47_003196, partial [Ixodes persulcatus]
MPLERLNLMAAGRATLENLGYHTVGETRDKQRIPLDLGNKIRVAPILRNMHPEQHKEQRRAREETRRKRYQGKAESARYTNAAKYTEKGAYAACSVDGTRKELASSTVRSQ